MASHRRRSTFPRRSLAEWMVRGMLALIAGVIGYVSVAHALALSMSDMAVERAHALAPWDGRIAGLLSVKLSGPGATASGRAQADRVARAALLQDPMAVSAVATLGLDAQIRGETKEARRLFTYSDRLSRRELRTRLWAIEDAVVRNDIPDALHHYDVALRTSRVAPDLLFPVLALASNDPVVAKALVRTLATKPVWSQGFLVYLASTGEDPTAMAQLLVTLNRAGVTTSEEVNAKAVERMVVDGGYGPAWWFYSQIRGNADPRRSRDPQFALATESPTAFDWVVSTSDNGIAASIQRGSRNSLFDFAAPPSVGGQLLQQLQLLPPGRYLLEGRSIGVDQPAESQPFWTLACPDGRELGRINVPRSAEAEGRFAGVFTVPAGCPAQYLKLVARPSNLISGVSGQIERVSLRPVS